jgi:hypothetical protein
LPVQKADRPRVKRLKEFDLCERLDCSVHDGSVAHQDVFCVD